jgi:hypothetical protein
VSRSQNIFNQYTKWPYPQIPLAGSVRRVDTWQLNLNYLKDRCGLPPPSGKPHILIVGCGTFQPYVFALANPQAKILATDISQKSLNIARLRNRLHGIFSVEYKTLDLNQPSSYPDGPFDFIECYGVLMNLAQPEETLKALAARLADDGIIRMMVYPYFSRYRIFQIQRLARLLGLHYRDQSHPAVLRKIMLSLPPDHPLRHAFTTYGDSQNDSGIVDGFLHAGDRGFTGHQLGVLISNAGLTPAFYFHRPWGQPGLMAEKLNLADQGDSAVLHYLDLWQELRTNFIVCLTRKNAPTTPVERDLTLHPLLTLRHGGPLHRIKIGISRLTGITLPSRTEADPIAIPGKVLRALSKPYTVQQVGQIEEAIRVGVLLGGPTAVGVPTPGSGGLTDTVTQNMIHATTETSIEIGNGVANPFYEAIFKTYRFAGDHPAAGLPPLAQQITRWRAMADPLEEAGGFGLTPFGTYLRFSKEITSYIETEKETVSGFDKVRFDGDDAKMRQVDSFLKQSSFLPKSHWSEAELRELWIFLFSYPHLFLNASRAGPGNLHFIEA